MNFEERRAELKEKADRALENVPFDGTPEPLRGAMRYSLLSPGKRLRASLCLAAASAAGGTEEDALPFAVALEMVHAYSLIHDDLPAMDNDTLRRGKPTNHVVYGEAMAILAGDALLNAAFETVLTVPGERAGRAALKLAVAAGSTGMVAGQALDISLEGTAPEKEKVFAIHLGKTAALITAAVETGMIMAGCDEKLLACGREYGRHLGLAFQITDDLLDLSGSEQELGKHAGKDEQEGKMTWPACVGKEQAQRDAAEHIAAAVAALEPLGERAFYLRETALGTLGRKQ